MAELKIEGILANRMITSSFLVEKYGFKSFSSGKVTRVNSAPSSVELCDAEFLASFIFINGNLERLILMPIIKNVEVPDYPCEEYQEIKRKYCTDILCSAYGDPVYNDDLCNEWETLEYKISCCSILEGRDKYCGGNIVIDMR